MVTRKASSGRTRRNAVVQDVLDATTRRLNAGERFYDLAIQEICEEAGVARSAFYQNFADKQDLLRRIVTEATNDLFETARRWAEGAGDKSEMIATQKNTVQVWREHATVLRAFFEAAATDPAIAAIWEGQLDVIIEVMRQRISDGQDAGLVSSDVDPAITAAFIVVGFERLTARQVSTASAATDQGFAEAISEAGWRLIYGAS